MLATIKHHKYLHAAGNLKGRQNTENLIDQQTNGKGLEKIHWFDLNGQTFSSQSDFVKYFLLVDIAPRRGPAGRYDRLYPWDHVPEK